MLNYRSAIMVAVTLLLFCGVTSAQEESLEQVIAARSDAINSVAALPDGDTLAASMKAGQGGRLILLSLRNCTEIRRFIYDSEIIGLTASKSDTGAVWGGQGETLKKWNVLDGKELTSVSAIPGEEIKGVSQDREGEYFAVWGTSKIALLRLSGDNATAIWAETAAFRVSDVVIDPSGGHFYISGYDGSVVKRNMRGGMANSFHLDKPVYDMDIDPLRGQLLIATGNQLLRLDITSSVFTRITSLPTDDIILSDDGKTLSALGGGIYTVYSYPSMKVMRTQDLKGNKLFVFPNGGAVTFANNTLTFFDQVKQAQIGKAYLLDSGVGFVSPELNYYGSDHFRALIAGGEINGVPPYVAESRDPDIKKACGALLEMVTSVYAPSIQPVSQPVVAKPGAPSAPVSAATAGAAAPAPTPTPVAPAASTQVSAPQTPSSPSPANKSETKGVTAVSGVQAPQTPIVQPVMTPTLAQGTQIPSWAINPNNQPAFSAVKSGRDGAQALIEGKKKIRDDVARSVMKNMLDIELVKNLESDEVKKRFLWQVGARTGQTAFEYAMQKDMWASQEGSYYVLAFIDSKSIDQIYEPIFQEEMNLLSTFGAVEYLKNDPVKWE